MCIDVGIRYSVTSKGNIKGVHSLFSWIELAAVHVSHAL